MAKSNFTSSDEISLTLNETVLRTLETSLRILKTSKTLVQATSSIHERIEECEKANRELVEAISITYESEAKADNLSSEQFNG